MATKVVAIRVMGGHTCDAIRVGHRRVCIASILFVYGSIVHGSRVGV